VITVESLWFLTSNIKYSLVYDLVRKDNLNSIIIKELIFGLDLNYLN
jgi:hypothetical protein